ncbi:MAG: hypothetical protein EXR39_17025 [Betaproteobacteria bacterium]|nr:hypothetical protein [Betaproteobacteria bacterium]
MSSALASSTKFRTFAVVFAIAMAVIYVVSELVRLPLFSYHPDNDRFDFGWVSARKDEGPAMHWYGWVATSLIAATVLGLLATLLPERVTSKIPLSLTWIVPVLLTLFLIYSLSFFWRW